MVRAALRVTWTALLASCTLWEAREQVDYGTVCLDSDGSAVAVTVIVPACLSSSCDRNASGSCAAELNGDEILVTSEASWEGWTGGGGCTKDCGDITASCGLDEVPDGTYTVVHGEDAFEVTLPATGACTPAASAR